MPTETLNDTCACAGGAGTSNRLRTAGMVSRCLMISSSSMAIDLLGRGTADHWLVSLNERTVPRLRCGRCADGCSSARPNRSSTYIFRDTECDALCICEHALIVVRLEDVSRDLRLDPRGGQLRGRLHRRGHDEVAAASAK